MVINRIKSVFQRLRQLGPGERENPFDEFRDLQSDQAEPAQRGAYFPRRYVTDFFEFVKANSSDIEVLSYADLPWEGNRADFAENYLREAKAWEGQLASGERDASKAYVFVQYDVDSRPQRTFALLGDPAHDGIPSNVMIFNKRIDRRRFKTTGEIAFTPYEIDEELLNKRRAEGFVVGYHSNAYEQANYNTAEALEIFDRDVKALVQRYDIAFFSAHGGVPGPDGRNNRDLPFHPDWQERLVWIHNGHYLQCAGQFSDGGHNSPLRDPKKRDLRDFVRTFRPGQRYRILLHPQYYDLNPRVSKRYGGTRWYDKMMRDAVAQPQASLWSKVRLGSV